MSCLKTLRRKKARPEEGALARDEIILTSWDSGQVIRAFPTPNFSTHFVLENAVTAYVAPLSYFPEEDKVLFSPLSRFLIREVDHNFPRNPGKVTLVYLNLEEASSSAPPSEARRTSILFENYLSPGSRCSCCGVYMVHIFAEIINVGLTPNLHVTGTLGT